MLIKGKNLTEKQTEQIISAFVHRNTFENMEISKRINPSCKVFVSDAQWIDDHAFYFVKDGSRLMDNRRHCEPHYIAD